MGVGVFEMTTVVLVTASMVMEVVVIRMMKMWIFVSCNDISRSLETTNRRLKAARRPIAD